MLTTEIELPGVMVSRGWRVNHALARGSSSERPDWATFAIEREEPEQPGRKARQVVIRLDLSTSDGPAVVLTKHKEKGQDEWSESPPGRIITRAEWVWLVQMFREVA